MNSQWNIETYVDRFFPEPGFFMEIGAWNGEHLSQTAYLEREKGWSGIAVDPFPVGFEERNCMLCSKAVSKDGRDRDFLKVSIDRRYGGDVSYFSGFKDSLKCHLSLIENYCEYEEIQVDTITIKELYERYNLPKYIEFLSVDTEGSEIEIFQSIDLKKYSFGLIVFEHNRVEKVRRDMAKILKGYTLYEALIVDDIYINNDLQKLA